MEEKEQTVQDLYPLIRQEFHKLTSVDYPEMNWEKLMQVVEFIENIDARNEYYKWEQFVGKDKTVTQYNFDGFSVSIEGKSCWIFLHLALDPGETISRVKSNSKFEATLQACYEFAVKRNKGEI